MKLRKIENMTKLRRLRIKAFYKQEMRCFYCQSPMWSTDRPSFALANGLTIRQAELYRCTAEHLLARSQGGSDNEKNIVAACYYCNSRRHRMREPLEPKAFKFYVQKKLGSGKWHVHQFKPNKTVEATG